MQLPGEPASEKTNFKRRRAMQRITTKVAFVLAVLTMVVGTAWAVSVHFKHGSPQAFDNGLTLTLSGVISGVGNDTTVINLSATADPDTTCSAPCSKEPCNQAPGQNPGAVTVTGTVALPPSEIKNGNLAFTVTTQPPAQPTPAAAGCPNDNWTAAITDLHFTSATITF